MEQLEFENYIDKIKKRKEEGDYKTAAKIADKIPWDEVEDVNLLMMIANVYEQAGKFNDAKELLEYAYEIAPVKNRLYYALSYIYIKCGQLKNGIEYYIDFCDNFPDDNRKQLLKYQILKAKNASYEQQKRILDEYVSEEKDEAMIFELALISDKLEEREEVLEYCNYIIKFFGVKKQGYGKNALLLKKKYTALTQEEEKLLEEAEIGYEKDENRDINFTEPLQFYNETRIDEDKRDVPVEKIERKTEKRESIKEEKKDELDEKEVKSETKITYGPDEESYTNKEKNEPAFMQQNIDKDKLKNLINRFKEEEKQKESAFNKFRENSFEILRRDKNMKLNETKLHMIIEAKSKDEGIEIAKKELEYIHDVFGEKTSIAKTSAYNINEKGFAYYLPKIENKDLIIENAGQLKNEAMDEIEEYIINKKGNTIFALIDVINNFDDIAENRPSFIKRFDVISVLSNRPQETLDVTKEDVENRKQQQKDNGNTVSEEKKEEPTREVVKQNEMTDEEFIEECKSYAKSIDCVILGDAITSLYEVIENMKEEKVPLNRNSAIAVVEEAADRAEKPKLFHKPQYDKEGCLVLSEEHFKF